MVLSIRPPYLDWWGVDKEILLLRSSVIVPFFVKDATVLDHFPVVAELRKKDSTHLSLCPSFLGCTWIFKLFLLLLSSTIFQCYPNYHSLVGPECLHHRAMEEMSGDDVDLNFLLIGFNTGKTKNMKKCNKVLFLYKMGLTMEQLWYKFPRNIIFHYAL